MPDNFGERLKKLRKKSGLTQEELSETLGISCMTVRRWESERSIPRIDEIRRIAQALNVPESDLLNDPPPNSGEWVITLKTATKFEKEEIDLTGNVQPVTSILATPDGCMVTIQAGWDMLKTKKQLEQLFKRIIKETYPAMRGNGVAFGSIKD